MICYIDVLFKHLEGAGELVRAACAAGVAVNAFKSGDDVVYLHSLAEFGYTMGVAVAASGEFDFADDVAFGLDVNLD